MHFISNTHAHYFLESFKDREQINDKNYCSLVYITSSPYPISDREDYYNDVYKQYIDIISNGLPSDVEKYLIKKLK